MRLLLWVIVGGLLLLFYMGENPWLVTTDAQLSKGAEIAREAQADVIIVIDYHTSQKSPRAFEEHDWSAAWINTIEQEFGPVTVATPRSLSHKVLGESRIVILTSSVSGQIPDALLAQLREHVEAGNLLLVERPSGVIRETWSADGRAGERRGQAFTFARGLEGTYFSQLEQVPLSTDFVGSTRALEGATTLLSIDGAPVVYAHEVGQGRVITVDFDYGEALTALQQGKPTRDFTLRPPGEYESPPRPEELVLKKSLIGAQVPYADLLERFMVHGVILPHAPAPTLWPFPQSADGVVVGVHPDLSLGDGGAWMLEHELERKGVSSLLTTMDSGLTASGAATIHRKGGDIGLLWRMPGTPDQLLEPIGLGGFKPLTRPVSLKQQLDALKDTLPVSYVRTARIAGGWWSQDWDAPFREMAEQGLRLDSTYETPRTSGYAWGTGFPFLAMKSDGTPLGIREMPVVIPDRAIEGPSLKSLLESSQAGHHMAMTYALRPAGFADYPDMERFNAWLEFFDEMERTGHLLTSAYRYDNFMRQRRASSMRSRLIDGVQAPRATSAPPIQNVLKDDKKKPEKAPKRGRDATLMRVTIEAKSRGMALAVPAHVRGRTFSSARQRSQRLGKEGSSAMLQTRVVSLVGYQTVLVPLERGFNTIDIYYTVSP